MLSTKRLVTATAGGNDYFGARYYASGVGRFLSPDWSAEAEPVPYANFGNPQSLNLYGYGLNNALRTVDLVGHYTCAALQNSFDCYEDTIAAQMPSAAQGDGTKKKPFTLQLPVREPYLACDMSNPQCQVLYGSFSFRPPQRKAPSNAPTAWSRWKSCVATGFKTLGNDLNPLAPSAFGAAQNAVDAQSQAFADAAAMQTVERGLTVPLRSSVVRSALTGSEVLGKVSVGITIVNLVLAGGDAINAEWQQCGWE